ncbi:MAG: DNA modification methylase [Anaerolineae bacterium]|nr:DNA modification methylase [Anaerolineae bacterium]
MKPYHKNPRKISDRQREQLKRWLAELGDLSGIVHNLPTDEIIGGNQRSRVFNINDCEIHLTETNQEPDEQGTIAHGFVIWRDHKYAYRQVQWTAEQCEAANVVANQAGGDWDIEILLNQFERDGLLDYGFDAVDLDALAAELAAEQRAKVEPGDAEPQMSRADELREVWGVELGQMWRLPSRVEGQEHRLICGDCTDAAVVRRVMGGEVAELVHADPPYGMGKEKDGIANDNLYREKLDAFQMAWWRVIRPCVADNGSAYIWGNAEDLWRLWYCGGLRDSERLTFRNELVWDKGNGQGMESDAHRMYPTATERALFFMLGEQGFNNNADNYWDGWEPIRLYLKGERDKMGWDNAICKTLAGHSPSSGCHWFDASQWSFVTEDVYTAWQAKAEGAAFRKEYDELRKEYDELRKEFYATRAYFDNTHDSMTDVWQFQRVVGDDRHDHATPKPVEMGTRAIKSSSQQGAAVYVPFGGTLPEVIAAENLSRQCRAVEISPAYVAVALQRYVDAFNITPELIQ